jgi:hypothetical protein
MKQGIVLEEFLRTLRDILVVRIQRTRPYAALAGKTCQVTFDEPFGIYCGPSAEHHVLSTMPIACRFANPENAIETDSKTFCQCTKPLPDVKQVRRAPLFILLGLFILFSVIGAYIIANRAVLKRALSEIARRFSESPSKIEKLQDIRSTPAPNPEETPEAAMELSTPAPAKGAGTAGPKPAGTATPAAPFPAGQPGDLLASSDLYLQGLKQFQEGKYLEASRKWKDMISSYRGQNYVLELPPRTLLDSVYSDFQKLAGAHRPFSLPGASGDKNTKYFIFAGLFQERENAEKALATLPEPFRKEGAVVLRVRQVWKRIKL